MSQTSVPSGSGEPPRRGFFVNVGSLVFARGFLALSQVLILPVVARHLAVEEFALMALAMSVVIFASVLSDAGLGRSLIRAKGFDQLEWSSVFWLLVVIGVLLSGAILLLAPIWAWYFGEPRLWAVLSALAVVPLMQSICAVPNAEIERREHYTAIARLQMVAAGVGLVCAMGLALANAGVWALVAQQVIVAVIRLCGMLYLSEFRPDRTFSRHRLTGHLRFARDTISTSIIGALQNEAGTLAVGKFLGPTPLGVFAMSQRFTRLPQFGLAGPMSAVVYVRMAKAQDSLERLVAIYLASCRLLAAVLIPALAMIAVAGREIFVVFLSETWAPVAPVFALSLPGILLEAVTVTCLVAMFRAVGRTDIQVRLIVEGALLKIPFVIAGALISIEAVAASYTLWALVYVWRGWALARKLVPLRVSECLGGLVLPTALSAVAGLIYVAPWGMSSLDPVWRIAEAIGLTCLVYAGVVALDLGRLRAAVQLFR